MLADKNAAATVNGLNQKFLLKPLENGRTAVVIAGDVSKEVLGKEVLIRINVDDIIERVYDGTDKQIPDPVSFIDRIHQFADMYERDEKIITPIHKDCKLCEFKSTPEQEAEGKLSGFKQCWSEQLDWQDDMFELPNILDLWDFRKKPELLEKGKYLMQDLTPDDIGNLAPGKDGILTRTERQWMQIKKAVEKDKEPYIDIEGLKSEFRQFRYPLHFIDFETSMVAVPFFKGRKPYEQIAFQYSHHIVYEDLTIEHKGQYLCKGKGVFPNFDFVRNLKSELENDNGSIFRYAAHENTVLNQIMVQLQEVDSDIVPDKKELIDFIQSISHSANHNGNRDMIDLLKLVKNYYYHPIMGGSNSIKAVLPAVLSTSEYIQTKYSKPIYGKTSQIKSLNFDDGWMWIQWDDKGNIISPYKLLPPIFDNLTDEEIEEFLMSNGISDGGAAMTAYAKMQFAEITDFERERIISGLLKYCELDTMAMVMIWEYFLKVIHKKIRQNDHSFQM